MSSASKHSLRAFMARRIGTPWWNLRFRLGMFVGGFTSAERRDDPTVEDRA